MVSKDAYMRQFRPPMGSDCCEHLLRQDRFAPIAFQGSLTVTVGKNFHNIRLSKLKYVYIDLIYAAFPDNSIVGHPLLDTQKSNQPWLQASPTRVGLGLLLCLDLYESNTHETLNISHISYV